MKLSDQLTKLIKEKGTNQRQVALKAKISPEYLGQIISGEVTNVGIEKIEALSIALDVHPMELLFPDEKRLYYANKVLEKYGVPKPSSSNEIPEIGFTQVARGGCFDSEGYPKGNWPKRHSKPEDFTDSNAYIIRVEGDSMEPFLKRGHRLFCATNQEAQNGDYAVVQLNNDEVIVKELSMKNGMIILKSINPLYEPTVVNKKEIRVMHPIIWIKRK